MSSRTSARIVAFSALFATTGALAAVVMQSPAERVDASPNADLHSLADETRALTRELERLDPGESGRPAQRAVRAAVAATEALRAEAGDSGEERTVNALDRELEYLDAVGSVLSNPRSTLASELVERAERANAALSSAPGGDGAAAAQGAWENLLEVAARRR